MDILSAGLLLFLSIILPVICNLIANEFYDRAPTLARVLIKLAAKRLSETESGRREEEWLAHLDECPGKIGQVLHACGCVRASFRLQRPRFVRQKSDPTQTQSNETQTNLARRNFIPANIIPTVHSDLPTLRPKSLKEFGYHPALSAFREGDLILFSPRNPSAGSRLIMDDQRREFSEDDARWIHAAVYVIDGKIVQAAPLEGVTMTYLHEYIPTHDILVRRHIRITDVQRAAIALHALSKLNTPYSWLDLSVYGFRAAFNLRKEFDPRTYNVCSGLYALSFMEATRTLLRGCQAYELVKPAQLSLTDSLTDIDIPWMRIE